MPTQPLADRIRALTDSFIREIAELVRTAAFEALENALDGTEQVARGKVRSKAARLPVLEFTPAAPPNTKRVAPPSMPPSYPTMKASDRGGEIAPPQSALVGSSGMSQLPSVPDQDQLRDAIVARLTEQPGLSAKDLTRMLGVDAEGVRRALVALRAEGRVLASEKSRGTRFCVASEELCPVHVATSSSLRGSDPSRSVLYIDESGIGGATGVTLMAGLLATRENWRRFEQEWSAVLSEPPAVGSFHMTDAHGRRRAFKGWTQDELDARLQRLSELIVRYVECSCTAYMSNPDYDAVVRRRIGKGLDDPYFPPFVCVVAGLSRLRGIGIERFAPIDVVLDYQQQFGHKALATTHGLFESLSATEAGLYGSICMRRKGQRIVPLEAADMLAWCQHRKLTNRDAQEMPAYRALIDGIPRNHFRVGAEFLADYVQSGFEMSGRST